MNSTLVDDPVVGLDTVVIMSGRRGLMNRLNFCWIHKLKIRLLLIYLIFGMLIYVVSRITLNQRTIFGVNVSFNSHKSKKYHVSLETFDNGWHKNDTKLYRDTVFMEKDVVTNVSINVTKDNLHITENNASQQNRPDFGSTKQNTHTIWNNSRHIGYSNINNEQVISEQTLHKKLLLLNRTENKILTEEKEEPLQYNLGQTGNQIKDANRLVFLDTERGKQIVDVTEVVKLGWMSHSIVTNSEHSAMRIVERDMCGIYQPAGIIAVLSAAGNFYERRVIRETWGASPRVYDLLVVFITARPSTDKIQQGLYAESAKYHDIIQFNFEDTYKNLTLKSIVTLRWMTDLCRSADFLLKVDDDVQNVDMMQLGRFWDYETHAKAQELIDRSIYCGLVEQDARPYRESSHRYYVSPEDYSADVFPPYCQGSRGYLLPRTVIRLFSKLSSHIKYFWVEDIYITGVLPALVGNLTITEVLLPVWHPFNQ